jgi:1-deoxy-D-xylulose-5-phosphate reductoisomerase
MSSISGLAGLEPTLKIIKYTKTIAIANKEAIICGWDLINGKIKRYKTNFIPVDSEHFSIWYALKNNFDKIEKIYLTASGGPFNKMSVKKFKNINIKQALKHPNWKMGKKISIDSAPMMNKVFEIIEAKNIFNVSYKKLSILIHPKSYIHAIVKFNNGMTKIIAHDTSMKIPILNSLNLNSDGLIKSKKLNLMILNNLDFQHVDKNKFPVVNILKEVPKSSSLFETLIVSANDELVELFLKKKIQFVDIYKKLSKLISLNEFQQYKKIKVKKLNSIIQLDKYVRLKIKEDYKTI